MSGKDATAASVGAATAGAVPAGAAPAAVAAGPRLLAGGAIAAEIRAGLARDFAAFNERWGYAPTLAVVLVGA